MVDNIVSKPLGLVLIVTAHMVFNSPSRAEVSMTLGSTITFEFTFNISVTKDVAVYTNQTKIAQFFNGKSSSDEGDFDVQLKNTSVIFRITNLKLNHSGIYSASLFKDSRPAIESNNKVQLIVREGNRTSTVTPMPNNIKEYDSGSPSFFSSHIVTLLVVPLVVLLATVLPLLIWCLVRTKDKQPPPQQQGSNPTVQETVDSSNNVPTPPLVYSVLDFPKRPPAVLEINPNDTEYAAVSYLPEKRKM
ncbi:uncharacterized protein LOC129095019 [Anoplopoma fimbria]|uniref:uncharacterized protein LOC129095019 n=1 Tax=Anoplopoma fimbria TaxID=229290 RepID=UPI0023EB88B9|nr:uncharacterized protein LOC129095019 [Anoplopoma fimbria]